MCVRTYHTHTNHTTPQRYEHFLKGALSRQTPEQRAPLLAYIVY